MKSRKILSAVGIISLVCSCTSNKHEDAFIGIYNLSERGDCSREAYIELALPIKEASIYKKNEDHCVVRYYERSGAVIVDKDTVPLLNNPSAKENRLYKSVPEIASEAIAIYFFYLKEYQGYSLEEIDRELQQKLRGINEVFFVDKDGTHKKLNAELNFHVLYFFDGQKVDKTSKEFTQKMRIDLPPKIEEE